MTQNELDALWHKGKAAWMKELTSLSHEEFLSASEGLMKRAKSSRQYLTNKIYRAHILKTEEDFEQYAEKLAALHGGDRLVAEANMQIAYEDMMAGLQHVRNELVAEYLKGDSTEAIVRVIRDLMNNELKEGVFVPENWSYLRPEQL